MPNPAPFRDVEIAARIMNICYGDTKVYSEKVRLIVNLLKAYEAVKTPTQNPMDAKNRAEKIAEEFVNLHGYVPIREWMISRFTAELEAAEEKFKADKWEWSKGTLNAIRAEERAACALEANREWDKWPFRSDGKTASGNIAVAIRSRGEA